MTNSTISVLKNARQNIVKGENTLTETLYKRASIDGVPTAILDIHKMTKGYMMLSMAEYSPITYFECLKKIKKIADNNENYRDEYKHILETLINIKQLVLRDIAINYFCEVSTCSWGSNYGKSLDDLYMYLETHISEIIESDCYALSVYRPECDIKKLHRDLKAVEAYALNLLLMYVTHKSTHYEGKSYYANAVDFGDYALVKVTSHDNYSHNAVARPRINQVFKEEYYNDYLENLKKISSEFKIHTDVELKNEVSRLVDRKGAKSELEKDYFEYAKHIAKDDPERRSFYNNFGSIYPGYNKLVKPILKKCWGVDEVGSFELDQPFTRKRFLGVCNMLAWANDWSVEMVRTIMLLACFCGVGVIAYFGLFFAMKANYYLPNFSVEKHI